MVSTHTHVQEREITLRNFRYQYSSGEILFDYCTSFKNAVLYIYI